MADEVLQRDLNRVTVIGAVTDDTSKDIFQVRGNPITRRLLIENDALHANTDGTYIGDIKFGESLPAGTNYLGQVGVTGAITIADVGVLSGSSRLGDVVITRDINDYISNIAITQGGTTRNLAITRNGQNLITLIEETII